MKPSRRSCLFLMELIFTITLFLITVVVCVPIFIKSHTVEKESAELNQAVFASVSVAEILRSGEDFEEILLKEFPETEHLSDTFLLYYDENWEPTSSSHASYELSVKISQEDNLLSAFISVSPYNQSEDTIYELTVQKHAEKEGPSL